MKKVPLLICLAVFFAFISDKKFTAEKLLAPPGTVQLIDSLYIDKCEVSNIYKKQFTTYINWSMTFKIIKRFFTILALV